MDNAEKLKDELATINHGKFYTNATMFMYRKITGNVSYRKLKIPKNYIFEGVFINRTTGEKIGYLYYPEGFSKKSLFQKFIDIFH